MSALASDREDRVLQLALPTQAGNAGGAVVREDGALVGILAGRADDGVYAPRTGASDADASLATRAAYLIPMLDPGLLAKPRRLDRAAAITRVAAATCVVLTARP